MRSTRTTKNGIKKTVFFYIQIFCVNIYTNSEIIAFKQRNKQHRSNNTKNKKQEHTSDKNKQETRNKNTTKQQTNKTDQISEIIAI